MNWAKLYSVYTDPSDPAKKQVMSLKFATNTTENADDVNDALKNNGYDAKTCLLYTSPGISTSL